MVKSKRSQISPGQRTLLNSGYQSRFYKGQLFSHEHRQKIAATNAKPYVFRGPDSIIYSGTNIEAFSLSQNLDPAMMRLVANGNCYCHRGWTLVDASPAPRSKPFKLISPTGEVVEGHGVRPFAIAIGVSPGHLSNVVNGKRPQCKNWRLATPENLQAIQELEPVSVITPELPPQSERFPPHRINQIRALRAQQGYSYREICQIAEVCHSTAVKYSKNVIKGQISLNKPQPIAQSETQ